MNAVLISIQPKWCELIASGKKTVEVRKTRPKLETPFKVYIYETQGRKYSFNVKADTIAKHDDDRFLDCVRGNPPIKKDKNGTPYFSYGRMKVIGEFVCDEIKKGTLTVSDLYDSIDIGCNETCLSVSDIKAYLGMKYVERKGDYTFYGWHISNLIIYDKPKELSEFKTFCKSYYDGENCDGCKYFINGDSYEYDESDCGCNGLKPITRPPQSWCYVEDMEDEAE